VEPFPSNIKDLLWRLDSTLDYIDRTNIKAGSHDNGYYPTLAELQSNRLLDKVVLLQGYEQIAKEIGSLGLPILPIDNLFRSEKILVPPKIQPVRRTSTPSSTGSYADECRPRSYNAAAAMHPRIRHHPPESPVSRPRRINPNLVSLMTHEQFHRLIFTLGASPTYASRRH
jgi:hypothetical protein